MKKRTTHCKRISSQHGSGFIIVLMTLMVVAILATAIATLVAANIRFASHQEKSQKAFYLARSGIDIAVSALLYRSETQTEQDALYYRRFGPADLANPSVLKTPAETAITFGPDTGTGPNDIMKGGTVNVTIGYWDDSALGVRWIMVNAVAILSDGSGTTARSHMRFRLDNPLIAVREKEASVGP